MSDQAIPVAGHPVARAVNALRARVRALAADNSGVSMIEFALILPILVTLGIFGTEVASMASARMQTSQIALTVADSAARLGQTENGGVTPTITEIDVDSVMEGAIKQGEQIDFEQNGRIILSSLERDAATGKQYIHWQRCRGNLPRDSEYGDDGANNGLTGTPMLGMGDTDHLITAPAGSAVMFVEVYYEYESLFGSMFSTDMAFKQEAAFIVRDDRNTGPGITGVGGNSDCS